MEDSLKGIFLTLTLIGVFIIAMLNFIILFPEEQGVQFAGDGNSYLSASNLTSSLASETTVNLNNLKNSSSGGYDQWDITVGFMGTNTVKQSSKSGITKVLTTTFTGLKVIAKQVFGSNSPIVWFIVTLSIVAGSYLIYALWKFVRTGIWTDTAIQ